MKIRIELNGEAVRQLIYTHLQEKLGDLPFADTDVRIEVKSKQNYKSEWERADFRAIYEKFHAV